MDGKEGMKCEKVIKQESTTLWQKGLENKSTLLKGSLNPVAVVHSAIYLKTYDVNFNALYFYNVNTKQFLMLSFIKLP